MLKNYLIISLRNILKNKFFAFINIFGLSVGIATSILIYLYILHELSYDKEQPKYERIFRIVTDDSYQGKVIKEAITPNPLIPALRNEMTVPESMTRIIYLENIALSVNNQKYNIDNILFVELQFFDVFNAEWLIGSTSVFEAPDVIVLTESAAKKLFGSTDIINKTIMLRGKHTYTVKGIVKDNRLSNVPYSILLSYNGYFKYNTNYNVDSWSTTRSGFQSFMVLKDIKDRKVVEKHINKVIRRNASELDSTYIFSLQPLSNVRTNVDYGTSNLNGFTNPIYIIIAAIVGFFVLLLGCINYINLTLLILIKRFKEIAIRKVNGAIGKNIIHQITFESVIIIMLSFLIAVLLAEISLPYVNTLLEGQIYMNVFEVSSAFIFMFILILILIAITSVLPSLKISSIKVIEIFGKESEVKGYSKFSYRNLLVIIQFFISVALITSTLIIAEQLKYLKTKDIGFLTKDIINCPISSNKKELLDNLKSQLLAINDVEMVSYSLGTPFSRSNMQMSFHSPFNKDGGGSLVNFKCVDYDYAKLFNLQIVAGRWWNSDVTNSSVVEFLVNETFIKKFEFPGNNESLGMVVDVSGNKGTIIGVVKDFHSASLRKNIGPIVFAQEQQLFYNMSIKLKPSYSSKTIQMIKDKWQVVFPDDMWDYQYLDDYIKSQYKGEDRTFKLALFASWIAICIAILGMIAISGYSIQQKIKMICLRKILGAEVPSLIIYLSKRFVYMVLVANIIGLPTAYYITNKWLNQFAYHININMIHFTTTLLISLIISILIISYYTIRTANQNPAVVLRNE